MASHKTIAKNTVFLYFRMIIWMLVSLYSSRVVLQNLGISDYGIYNIVGGVVAIFGFLNASLSGATSRFFSYEIGQGDDAILKKTFSSAILAHISIAFGILFLAETIGLWLLDDKLVIPDNRLHIAKIVYQFSILTTLISIVTVPFVSLLLAREKMFTYSVIEIISVLLKLIIAISLPFISIDKLLTYSFLILTSSIVVFLIYSIFCYRNFNESHIIWKWESQYIKPILSFSSWDLFGNLGARVYQQGTSMLLNVFFGVVLNAASGIAGTIQGVISGFSANMTMAFRPQIIQQYAKKNYSEMLKLFTNSLRLSSLLLLLIVIPLCAELNYIVKLWLGNVPKYAVSISKILLYTAIINEMQLTCNIIIHATGRIKLFSIVMGSLFSLSVVVVYFLFKYTHFPLSAYYFFVILHIIILLFDLFYIKKNVPIFAIGHFIKIVILPVIILLLLGVGYTTIIQYYFQESFLRLIIQFFGNTLLIGSFAYLIILDNDQKLFLTNKVKIFYKK